MRYANFRKVESLVEAFFIGGYMITRERLKEILSYDETTGIFTWKVSLNKRIKNGSIAGCLMTDGYICISIYGKLYRAHRLAWIYITGEFPEHFIDHKNRVRSDNSFINLRLATDSINSQNQSRPHSNNKTGFLGVTKKGHRFCASIKIEKKDTHLGYFDTPEEASYAYIEAKRKYHEGCTI